MIWPVLRRGMSNPAVAAMKAATKRALAAHNLPSSGSANDAYGVGAVLDVRRMKKAWRLLPIDGSVVGDRYWTKLREGQFIGDYGIGQIQRYNRQVAAADAAAVAAAEEVAARTTLAGVSLRVYNERWRYLYAYLGSGHERPYSTALFSGGRWYDCSSMVTVIHHEAGRPDPNGRGYDGYGFTGTLWPRGTFTTSPRSGDLAFYGRMSDGVTPSHVAIHISPEEIVSFGSNPVRRLSVRYRSDYRGSRSYI